MYSYGVCVCVRVCVSAAITILENACTRYSENITKSQVKKGSIDINHNKSLDNESNNILEGSGSYKKTKTKKQDNIVKGHK